jgi:hypothetical protein
MANVDLDAAKRARAEQRGEPNTVTFGGLVFELVPEIGYEVAEALQAGSWQRTMEGLLGDEQAKTFFEQNPTVNDLRTLLYGDADAGVIGILEIMAGENPGESSASSPPSTQNGNASRQPSNLNTASS